MNDYSQRTSLLLGKDGMESLAKRSVAVVGLGGVGGYVAESLIRVGVGKIILMDHDYIDETNINRQLISLKDNVGSKKVKIWEERAHAIREDIKTIALDMKYNSENKKFLWDEAPDYIADAIDDVENKILLIEDAKERGLPIISAMGAGNKLDPLAFKVGDIFDTSYDALARVIRRRLKKLGIDSLKVVYSEEQNEFECRNPVGSISYAPAIMGLIMSAEIIKDLR